MLKLFISFSAPWYLFFLSVFTLQVLRAGWHSELFQANWQPGVYLLNILLGVVFFGFGAVLVTATNCIKTMVKKKILFLTTALIVFFVAADAVVEVTIAKNTAISALPIIDGWLEINPVHIKDGSGYAAYTFGNFHPSMSVIAVIFGILIFLMTLHFCTDKSYLYASAIFFLTGFICRLLSNIMHAGGYVYIEILPLVSIGLQSLYIDIGFALLIFSCAVNYGTLKKIKWKDAFAYFRSVFKTGIIGGRTAWNK